MSAAVALSETGNDRIAMGANLDPFTAHQVNVDDLYVEADAWLDGKDVGSTEEAEAIDLLIKMARTARDEADKARAAEKKPHDDAAKAVQAKWKPLVERAQRILDVCLEKVGAWRVAEAKRKQDEADAAAAAAELERQAEVDATRSAGGNLSAREEADQLAVSATQAEKVAKKAQKAAQTGNGLRTVPRAEITDFAAAARFYWGPERASFEALVLEFAQRDARAGKREIPGVTIHLEKKAV